MKTLICSLGILGAVAPGTMAQMWTNFIRQTQYPSGVQWDVPVASAGNQLSPLPVDQSGARFELWTVKSQPVVSYLLDSQYVGTYVPSAGVVFSSEDPYAVIPRTRADRPFTVEITVSGLLDTAEAPPASKSVQLRRYVQDYGAEGTGEELNRDLATLLSEATIQSNGTTILSYAITAIPGADRSRVRGEERFAVYSLPDYQAAEDQLASAYIQIWPLASGSISGLSQGVKIKAAAPTLTLTLENLYPSSQTYAQVYRGDPVLGTQGAIVPGSALVVNDSVPRNATLSVAEWDEVLTEDGRWTLELLTSTVFGLERLACVSFDLDRTIRLNGSVTTAD